MRRERGRSHGRGSLRALTALLLAIAVLWPLAGPVGAAAPIETDPPLSCREISVDPQSGVAITLRGCSVPEDAPLQPLLRTRSFLGAHHEILGLEEDLGNLRFVESRYGLNSTHVLFEQIYEGVRVYGAYISVHLDSNAQVQVLHNTYRPELSVDEPSALLSAHEAVAAAKKAIDFVAARGSSPAPEPTILVREGNLGRHVWRVMLVASEPEGDWEVLVDAASGEVLKRYNRLILDQALVFDPNPTQRSGETDTTEEWPALEQVTLQGLDGSGWLRGEYVDVTRPVGYLPASAYEPDGEFRYQPDDPRFEEVMVYYHIDATQRYIQSLGYGAENEPPNGIRDRVTYASPHWFEHDQSFYSVSDDALHFGDGGIEDAEDADIIVHEYAHALQHDILGSQAWACWGEGEMDALGEGFGDYLAASRFADVGEDPACIAEWDSQSYAPGPPYCLRRVDRDRAYPQDTTGDPHQDGEIWSRALWDLRLAVGARIADTLALESHFYLPCAASLADGAKAILDADLNVNQGKYQAIIADVMMSRGLLPLSAPTILSPGDGDILAPGAPTDLVFTPNQGLATSYQAQYTLGAGKTQSRLDTFESDLPTDYISFGNSSWQIVNGMARSGAIEHQQSSSLLLKIDLASAGELSFRYRVSSEPGWDIFEVIVDGETTLETSGEVSWTMARVELEAGSHDILWQYGKDATMNAGSDGVWIDDVAVTGVDASEWVDIEVLGGFSAAEPVQFAKMSTAAGVLTWQVPEELTTSAQVRVRALVEDQAGPWGTSEATFMVGEPSAVRLGQFTAESTTSGSHWPPGTWVLAGGLSLVSLIFLRKVSRRQETETKEARS